MYLHLLEKGASPLRCLVLNLRQIFTQACRFVKNFPSHGAGDGKGLMISDFRLMIVMREAIIGMNLEHPTSNIEWKTESLTGESNGVRPWHVTDSSWSAGRGLGDGYWYIDIDQPMSNVVDGVLIIGNVVTFWPFLRGEGQRTYLTEGTESQSLLLNREGRKGCFVGLFWSWKKDPSTILQRRINLPELRGRLRIRTEPSPEGWEKDLWLTIWDYNSAVLL